jgi:hypothetical protein
MGGTLALLFCMFFNSSAEARFCGDDVAGVRVPCACGDVVASDTVLRPGDPIVSVRCPSHGLRVRADATADSITLNLGGLAIVGSGRGIGLKVEYGGNDGAVVVGGDPPRLGEVVGFGVGVTSSTARSLARLERVSAKGNAYGGVMLRQAGAIVQDIVADKNGGHGIHVVGSGGRFLGLHADENKYRGISINSPGAIVSGSGSFNGTHGVVVPGRQSRLEAVEAHGNRVDGIVTRRHSQSLGDVKASGNGKQDLRAPNAGSTGAIR